TEPYFTYDRFIAILHNEVVYVFIIIGYTIYDQEEIRLLIKNNSLYLLFCVTSIIVISSLISVNIERELYFDNIATKIFNGFPQTIFTKTGWYDDESQVRNMAFTLYPNSTAILLLLLY